jgi:hypothetical protein
LVFVWRLVKLVVSLMCVCVVSLSLCSVTALLPILGLGVACVFRLLSSLRSGFRTYKCCALRYKRLVWCGCGAGCVESAGSAGLDWENCVRLGLLCSGQFIAPYK